MCYNCGCEMPDNDMGKGMVSKGGGSLTNKDWEHMAGKWNMSVEDTKKNVFELLKKQLKSED